MKRYQLNLFFRLLLIVLLASGSTFLLVKHYYYAGGIVAIAAVWAVYNVFRFLSRTVKDTQRLIDAIHFSEFSVSFKKAVYKGLPLVVAENMEKSVQAFRDNMLAIEREQQFYVTLLNQVDFAIIVVADSGEIKWINQAGINEFGRPQPRYINDLKRISSDLLNRLETMLPGETNVVALKKDGVSRNISVNAAFLKIGNESFRLFSFRNIQFALDESEVKAWQQLIRVLTHEMMNSITPIISLAETFSDKVAVNENDYGLMSQSMQVIHRRSKGLMQFVQNYRKLARIPEPLMEYFSAGELMENIERLLKAEGIKFSYSVTPKDVQLLADKAQMEQVLINLLKNAWESVEKLNEPMVSVSVLTEKQVGIIITVADNGIGILPEELEQIFVPFYTTKPTGSGIGLSITRQIVVLHKGSIHAESQPGKGSKFTIKLPG